MNKLGMRIVLASILIVVMVIGSVSAVSAAPPKRTHIVITGIESGIIEYNFYWDKLQGYSYEIYVEQRQPGGNLTDTFYYPSVPLGGRTPSYESGGMVLEDSQIIPNYNYQINIHVLGRNGRELKHSYAQWNVFLFP